MDGYPRFCNGTVNYTMPQFSLNFFIGFGDSMSYDIHSIFTFYGETYIAFAIYLNVVAVRWKKMIYINISELLTD